MKSMILYHQKHGFCFQKHDLFHHCHLHQHKTFSFELAHSQNATLYKNDFFHPPVFCPSWLRMVVRDQNRFSLSSWIALLIDKHLVHFSLIDKHLVHFSLIMSSWQRRAWGNLLKSGFCNLRTVATQCNVHHFIQLWTAAFDFDQAQKCCLG